MRIKWLFILLFAYFPAKAQMDVDYTHKSIIKGVEKTWEIDFLRCQPVTIHSNNPLPGQFFSTPTTHKKYIYVGRVNSCRAGGCSINNDSNNGPSEYFDYFVLFNEKGEVELVKIYNYAATHGQEVTSRGWLKQFYGHSPEENLEVGKDIDSISGATISVHSLTKDVNEKTRLLYEYLTQETLSGQL